MMMMMMMMMNRMEITPELAFFVKLLQPITAITTVSGHFPDRTFPRWFVSQMGMGCFPDETFHPREMIR